MPTMLGEHQAVLLGQSLFNPFKIFFTAPSHDSSTILDCDNGKEPEDKTISCKNI